MQKRPLSPPPDCPPLCKPILEFSNSLPPKKVIFSKLNLPSDFPIQTITEKTCFLPNYMINTLHFHNCVQIGYCCNGSGYILVNGMLYPYSEQSISIIPAKLPHFYTSRTNEGSIWKWIYVDLFNIIPKTIPSQSEQLFNIMYRNEHYVYILEKKSYVQIDMIIRSIFLEMEEKKYYYKETVQYLFKILSLLLIRISPDNSQTYEETQKYTIQIIAPAIEYISTNYMESISISYLAELCYISPTHLRRMFRKIMSCSPMEYLQTVRLEAACTLLLNSDISVLNIGEYVGFSSSTSFSRQFKKHFGTTPGKWRLQLLRPKNC